MATVYFFGTNIAPSQEDYTKDIFRAFLAKARNECQICIHRKDNYLHYAYLRRISHGTYFGICVVLGRIYDDIGNMFSIFDNLFTAMVSGGELLTAVRKDVIRLAVTSFAQESVARNEYAQQLINNLSLSSRTTTALPPVDFSIAKNDCIELSIEQDTKQNILDATKRYVNLYIVKRYAEIAKVTSFFRTIESKDIEIKTLTADLKTARRELSDAKEKLTGAKKRSRNTIIISLLSIVLVIAGVVIWTKVLFPTEVTNKHMAEYNYYGPLNKAGKPDGIGVAIYPDDDENGRKYYFGAFVNGERQDTAAVLFYNNGDFFYGEMQEDQWLDGTMYVMHDDCYFTGTFHDNEPWTGRWYDFQYAYSLKYGERQR